MSGAYQQQTRELISPMLKAWMEQFANILSTPVPSEDTDDWGLRMEVHAPSNQQFPHVKDSSAMILFKHFRTGFLSNAGCFTAFSKFLFAKECELLTSTVGTLK